MEEPLSERIKVNIDKDIGRVNREDFIIGAIARGGEPVYEELPEEWKAILEPYRGKAQKGVLTAEDYKELKKVMLSVWEKTTEQER